MNKTTGVVLAGGLARRMNKQDKGLIIYNNRPLISYALEAIALVANPVYINANRNLSAYKQFGYQVISDQTDSFDGPLAGVYSAMIHSKTDNLIVMPCDSPLIKSSHLAKLLAALQDDIEIAVAYDGKRMHPVFLALTTSLQGSLNKYLLDGQRKIDVWLKQHHLVLVDFAENAEVFLNINTQTELDALANNNDR